MQTIQLANGITIPVLGFGVYQIPPEETEQAVINAVRAGYRHIDTAQAYVNESEVGRGIARCGVAREELFVTTKVWVENAGEEAAAASLERYQAAGKIRAIGVSNFTPDRAVDLGIFNQVMPQANQIEINPFHQRNEQIAALQSEGIAVEAWAPFAEGKNGIFQNPVLAAIGKKYGKSVAQVIIRWLVERDIVVLAKSVKPERMAENLNVFDFALSDEDKAAIAGLDTGESQFMNHQSIECVREAKSWVFDV